MHTSIHFFFCELMIIHFFLLFISLSQRFFSEPFIITGMLHDLQHNTVMTEFYFLYI